MQDESINEEFDEGTYSSEQAEQIYKRFRETMGKETVLIKTEVAENPLPVTASKFGGLPYWEKGAEFPRVDSDDEDEAVPLILLAQINFAEVPHLSDYPESGMLQIFIHNNDLYGMDYDEPTKQDMWRIVWHDEVCEEKAMSESELQELGVMSAKEASEDDDGCLPFEKEYSLSFEKNVTYLEQCLDDFSDKIKKVAKELGFPVFSGGALDWFEEDDYNSFADERFFGENGIPRHQIGGYPFYTQGDVRREDDILLFQLDSENRKGICWGDMGIANFFISLENLKKRDFSNVIYNWDCY